MVFAFVNLVLPLTCLVLGGVMLFRGLRGRVTDDHPLCRPCGFDLVGLDPLPARCPECGHELAADSVRVGHRRRRPLLAVSGGLIVLFSGMYLGTALGVGMGALTSVMPAFVLRLQAATLGYPKDAVQELTHRAATGRLGTATARAIADSALSRRPGDWVGTRALWGSYLETANAAGLLSASQSDRFFREAVSVMWSGNSELFNGGSTPGLVLVFQPAVGNPSALSYTALLESATLDGATVPVAAVEAGVYYHHVPNTGPRDTHISLDLPARVAGNTLVVRWRVTYTVAVPGAAPIPDWVHTETIRFDPTDSGLMLETRTRPAGE